MTAVFRNPTDTPGWRRPVRPTPQVRLSYKLQYCKFRVQGPCPSVTAQAVACRGAKLMRFPDLSPLQLLLVLLLTWFSLLTTLLTNPKDTLAVPLRYSIFDLLVAAARLYHTSRHDSTRTFRTSGTFNIRLPWIITTHHLFRLLCRRHAQILPSYYLIIRQSWQGSRLQLPCLPPSSGAIVPSRSRPTRPSRLYKICPGRGICVSS